MNAEHIIELATFASDVVETDGGTCTSITMGEMADGSGRS